MTQISSSRSSVSRSSSYSSSAEAGLVAKSLGVIAAISAVWLGLGLIFAPLLVAFQATFSFCFRVVGSLFEVGVGLVVGAWHGIHFGFAAIKALATFALIHPSIGSAMAGICAGLVIALIFRVWDVHEKKSSPVVNSLFSTEVWQSRDFYLMLLINLIIGYLATEALSAVGMITSASSAVGPSMYDVGGVVLSVSGGGGGGGGGDTIATIAAFFLVLAALIVVGAIAGAFAGTIVGTVFGSGPFVADVNSAIHGAASGATAALLAKGKAPDFKTRLKRVLLGAALGFGDGMIVGAVVGLVFGLGHLSG